MVEVGLKLNQRQPQGRFTGEEALAQQALFERTNEALRIAIFPRTPRRDAVVPERIPWILSA